VVHHYLEIALRNVKVCRAEGCLMTCLIFFVNYEFAILCCAESEHFMHYLKSICLSVCLSLVIFLVIALFGEINVYIYFLFRRTILQICKCCICSYVV